MRPITLGCALLLACLSLAACEDNDLLPNEPRRTDGGLHNFDRDASMDAATDNDSGDTDGGNAIDAGATDE
jgi:hypothetical protein